MWFSLENVPAVRESQSPQTTITRSQSPDYWAPPPVSTHQEHYFNALLPSSHRLVSNIDSVLYLTHLPLYFSQLFLSSDLRSSPDSAAQVLLHLHAETSTGSPGYREKDISRSDKDIALYQSLRSHLDSLPCFNPLHTFNKPAVVYTYLPVSCVSADRRPDPNSRPEMESRDPAPTDPFEELISALRAALSPVLNPPSASASPMALPTTYSGEAEECSGFLLQLSLFIEMQPQQFTSECSKVAFLISLLSGRALLWARAIWNSQSGIINSFNAFTTHFGEVFGLSTGSLSIADQLIRLRQGTSSVSAYTLQFRTLAASCGWNETALLTAYRQGLAPQIRAQMAVYEDNMGLESFMQKAVKISQRLTACLPEETAHSQASPAACSPVPEPMQLDSNRLTRAERERRLTTGLCLYCGASGHFIQKCPSRPPRPAVSTLQVEPEISILSLLTVQLLTPFHSISVSALIDSGSSGNFISQNLLKRLNLPRKRQDQDLKIETIQGKPLGRGRIRHRSPPITLQIGCFHRETLSLLVLEGSTVDLILGRPWLAQHSPTVRWESSEILKWSESCFQNCLSNVPVPLAGTSHLQVNSTLVESPESLIQHVIPSDYMAFQDVFSKQAATQLPPHRPWDCAIDLLPGATLPKGRVYPCPSRSARQWMTTSRRLSSKSSSVLPPHRPPRASSSWERKTEACGPALITGPSMLTQLNSPIHFLWSRPRSRNSVGLASSRSWTCGVRITSFVSGRATSGRLDS